MGNNFKIISQFVKWPSTGDRMVVFLLRRILKFRSWEFPINLGKLKKICT